MIWGKVELTDRELNGIELQVRHANNAGTLDDVIRKLENIMAVRVDLPRAKMAGLIHVEVMKQRESL